MADQLDLAKLAGQNRSTCPMASRSPWRGRNGHGTFRVTSADSTGRRSAQQAAIKHNSNRHRYFLKKKNCRGGYRFGSGHSAGDFIPLSAGGIPDRAPCIGPGRRSPQPPVELHQPISANAIGRKVSFRTPAPFRPEPSMRSLDRLEQSFEQISRFSADIAQRPCGRRSTIFSRRSRSGSRTGANRQMRSAMCWSLHCQQTAPAFGVDRETCCFLPAQKAR